MESTRQSANAGPSIPACPLPSSAGCSGALLPCRGLVPGVLNMLMYRKSLESCASRENMSTLPCFLTCRLVGLTPRSCPITLVCLYWSLDRQRHASSPLKQCPAGGIPASHPLGPGPKAGPCCPGRDPVLSGRPQGALQTSSPSTMLRLEWLQIRLPLSVRTQHRLLRPTAICQIPTRPRCVSLPAESRYRHQRSSFTSGASSTVKKPHQHEAEVSANRTTRRGVRES